MSNLILFFDTNEQDRDFFAENLIDDYQYRYILADINKIKDLTEEEKNSKIISVFTKTELNKDVLTQFPQLELLVTRSVGVNHIDLEYCKAKGISVLNTPNYGDRTIAEFTFGLILDLIRKISLSYFNLKNNCIDLKSYSGIELDNKVLGIVGLGAIGTEVAKIAKNFGMNILAFDINKKQKFIDLYGVQYVELEELVKISDIITIHSPLTKQNFHLFDENIFKKMKRTAYLINTARGEIVDTKALYSALKNGEIAGAALDVVECEELLANNKKIISEIDLIDSECLKNNFINTNLLTLDNVIITPHIAYDTDEAKQRIREITIQNIKNYIQKISKIDF